MADVSSFQTTSAPGRVRAAAVRLTALLEPFLRLLGNRTCLVCETELRRAALGVCLCASCTRALLRLALAGPVQAPAVPRSGLLPGFAGLWAAYAYESPLRDCLLGYKFHGRWQFLVLLQRLFVKQAVSVLGAYRPHGLVPVPAALARSVLRGSDLPSALARALSRQTGIAVVKALSRPPWGLRQTRKGRSERLKLSRRGYRLRRREAVAGKRLLLIDDVLTTGGTARACAEVLLRGGACSVGVLVLARD